MYSLFVKMTFDDDDESEKKLSVFSLQINNSLVLIVFSHLDEFFSKKNYADLACYFLHIVLVRI